MARLLASVGIAVALGWLAAAAGSTNPSPSGDRQAKTAARSDQAGQRSRGDQPNLRHASR